MLEISYVARKLSDSVFTRYWQHITWTSSIFIVYNYYEGSDICIGNYWQPIYDSYNNNWHNKTCFKVYSTHGNSYLISKNYTLSKNRRFFIQIYHCTFALECPNIVLICLPVFIIIVIYVIKVGIVFWFQGRICNWLKATKFAHWRLFRTKTKKFS